MHTMLKQSLRARKKQLELGDNLSEAVKAPKATWMFNGSHWPGTWTSGEEGHSKGDHEGIIQVNCIFTSWFWCNFPPLV